jgi:hypothetical protein
MEPKVSALLPETPFTGPYSEPVNVISTFSFLGAGVAQAV